jgi:hypothetical protein
MLTWLYLPHPFSSPFFIRFLDHEGKFNSFESLEKISSDDIVDTGNILKRKYRILSYFISKLGSMFYRAISSQTNPESTK